MLKAVEDTWRRFVENRRYASRRSLRLNSVLADSGSETVIHDISATGLLIETSQEVSIGETLIIDLPERPATPATVVWNSGRYFGCKFDTSIPSATVSAALLRSSPTETRPAVDHGPNDSMIHGLVAEAAGEDVPPEYDRYSLRTRVLIIVSLAGLSWALVFWLIWLNWN